MDLRKYKKLWRFLDMDPDRTPAFHLIVGYSVGLCVLVYAYQWYYFLLVKTDWYILFPLPVIVALPCGYWLISRTVGLLVKIGCVDAAIRRLGNTGQFALGIAVVPVTLPLLPVVFLFALASTMLLGC